MFILSRLPDTVRRHLTVTRDGCWTWDVLTASGTPRIWVDGRWRSARRHVYTLVYGPIDKEIAHLRAACGRQQCVNPAHIQPKRPPPDGREHHPHPPRRPRMRPLQTPQKR